jgi:hypothetical protein
MPAKTSPRGTRGEAKRFLAAIKRGCGVRVSALIMLAVVLPGAFIHDTPARGENAPLLQTFVADPGVHQHLLDAAKRSTVFIRNPCAAARFTFGAVGVVVPPQGDAVSGKISKAMVKQQIEEDGCGAHRTLNALAIVRKPGELVTLPLLPGSTRGSPILERDAARYAMTAFLAGQKGCTDAYIADTAATPPPATAAGATRQPWEELWTVVGCGHAGQVRMHFTPDATGTTIGAGPVTFVPLPTAK